jgi:hypothetical protein
MPNIRLHFDDFTRGLQLSGPSEIGPQGSLRVARGVKGKLEKYIVSRFGSKRIAGDNSHSLFYFMDAWYCGTEEGTLVQAIVAPPSSTIVNSGLAGTRLRFVRMAPTAGLSDYLFVAGGGMGAITAPAGNLFKVADDGLSISRWGIVPPPNGFDAVPGAAGTLTGVYLYRVTYKSSVTKSRSNPNTEDTTVEVTDQAINLSDLPVSTDPQVDLLEIWRTIGNQALFFKVTEIANGTTTYTDTIDDLDLEPEQLPFDNIDPSNPVDFAFHEIAGPHQGRMWYAGNRHPGTEGYVYYSPIGRAEAVQGFIAVTSNDTPVQRIVPWNAALYAITEHNIIEVFGLDEPFSFREIYGAPGTVWHETIVPTPFGIVYRDNQESFRLFDGVRAHVLGMSAMTGVLRGGNAQLDFSDARYAGYGRDEYLISDGLTQFFGLYLGKLPAEGGAWREFGNIAPTVFWVDDLGNVGYSFGMAVPE